MDYCLLEHFFGYVSKCNHENFLVFACSIGWLFSIFQAYRLLRLKFLAALEDALANSVSNAIAMWHEKKPFVHSESQKPITSLEIADISSEYARNICQQQKARDDGFTVIYFQELAVVTVLVLIELFAGFSDSLGFIDLYALFPLLHLLFYFYAWFTTSSREAMQLFSSREDTELYLAQLRVI